MRLIRTAGLLSALAVAAGCYTLQPAGTAPQPGTDVAFDITDAGRVALAPLVGPEVEQIEGRLSGTENNEYVINVSAVRTFRGGEQVWSGERVTVKPEYVARSYERRYSRGRTFALATVGVGGFAAFMITRSLLGSGSEGSGGPPPPPGTSLIRP